MTAQDAGEAVRFLLAAYPTQRQRMQGEDVRGMVAAYAAGLADVTLEHAKAAITRLVRSSEWLPTVAAIRAAIGVIEHGPQMAGGEAWGSVVRAQRNHGSHQTPGVDFTFGDPITARVVKSLGWRELCSSENSAADRARFIETYNQIAATERTEAQAADGGTNPQLNRGSDPARQLISGLARQLKGDE